MGSPFLHRSLLFTYFLIIFDSSLATRGDNPFAVDKSTWADVSQIHELPANEFQTTQTSSSTCDCDELNYHLNAMKTKLKHQEEQSNFSCSQPDHKRVNVLFTRLSNMLKNKVNRDILTHMKDDQIDSGINLQIFLSPEFLRRVQRLSSLSDRDCHHDDVMAALTYLLQESYLSESEPLFVRFSTQIFIISCGVILLLSCFLLFTGRIYKLFLLILVASYVIEFNKLYEMEMADRVHALPQECVPQVPAWYSSIFASFSGAFFIPQNVDSKCPRLIASQLSDINPLLRISPLRVLVKLFSDSTGLWIEDMSIHSGQAFVNFFGRVPAFWVVYVLPVVVITIIIVILIICSFLGGYNNLSFLGFRAKIHQNQPTALDGKSEQSTDKLSIRLKREKTPIKRTKILIGRDRLFVRKIKS